MFLSTILICALLFASCSANAQDVNTIQPFTVVGDSLPQIKHMTDMKITGDTLWFVYETADGFGQRFLRSAVIDSENNTLTVSEEIGRKADGHYVSYMPFPIFGYSGNIQVVNQDDGDIFCIGENGGLERTRNNIFSRDCILPIPLSQYVQDVSAVSPDSYVFIGREPNGGAQYAMKTNIATAEIDTIRKIQFSSELTSWMPNVGELACNKQFNCMAFAYRLHPVIDIFGMDGSLIRQVRVGPDTFNLQTTEEADFEELNPIHFIDISVTSRYIYALHWGCKYSEVSEISPIIYKIDWDGNIIDQLSITNNQLHKIAVSESNRIIGWDGNQSFNRIEKHDKSR